PRDDRARQVALLAVNRGQEVAPVRPLDGQPRDRDVIDDIDGFAGGHDQSGRVVPEEQERGGDDRDEPRQDNGGGVRLGDVLLWSVDNARFDSHDVTGTQPRDRLPPGEDPARKRLLVNRWGSSDGSPVRREALPVARTLLPQPLGVGPIPRGFAAREERALEPGVRDGRR